MKKKKTVDETGTGPEKVTLRRRNLYSTEWNMVDDDDEL